VGITDNTMTTAPPGATSTARRIDWRFLLPVPRSHIFDKVVLVGADTDLFTAFAATGLGREVTTTTGDHDADLVAVCAPAVADPGAVVRAARPGALIYIEVDRRQASTRTMSPRRLAAALAADGAWVSAQYALRPAPDRCELFVPLDRSGALQWFLSSVYIASTPLKRIGETLVRMAAGSDARRIGAFAPFHATVAAVPTATGSPQGDAESGSIAMLVHGGARVVQVGFSDESPGLPQFVAKFPKLHTSVRRTRHEQMMVARIRRAIGAPDNDSIPTPRALVDTVRGPVSVEEVASGSSLARRCGRWGRSPRAKAEDLRMATAWLIRFHGENAIGDSRWDEERLVASVDRPLAEFVSRFGTTDAELELFAATRAAARELLGQRLPVVWEHGDFTIWNIFRDGDRIRVLDWEHSRAGLPLVDLIRLTTHWHEAVRDLSTPDGRCSGFADLFTGNAEHPATREALAALDRYEEALQIDRRFRSVFVVLSRVELAVRRYEHQAEGSMMEDDVRAGNSALAYISALAERRADLFPAPSSPVGSVTG